MVQKGYERVVSEDGWSLEKTNYTRWKIQSCGLGEQAEVVAVLEKGPISYSQLFRLSPQFRSAVLSWPLLGHAQG